MPKLVRRRSAEQTDHSTTAVEDTPPVIEVEPPTNSPAVEIPPDPGQMEFFQMLESLSDADWETHVVYLYRQHPAISKAAEGAYIWKVNRPIDEDDVLMAHGSGRYTAALYRKAPRNKIKIRTHTFSVYNSELPPKVLPGQVTRTPQNQDYFDTWGKLQEKGGSTTAASAPLPAAGAPTADPGNSKAVEALAEIARRSQETPAKPSIDPVMVDLWKETAKDRDSLAQRLADKQTTPTAATDPLALVAKVFDFTERLKPPPPPPTADPLTLVREVLATVKETQQPARSAVDQVNDLAALITAVREITDSGRPEPEPEPKSAGTPWWAQLLIAFGPAIAPLAQAAAQRLMNTPPAASPQPAAPAAAVQPVAIASPAPPAPQPLSPQEEAVRPYLELINAIAPTLISAVETGRTGGDYAAEFVSQVQGGDVIRDQMREAGAETVYALVQMLPDIWNRLQALPRWPLFLEEFLTWEPPPRPRVVVRRKEAPVVPAQAPEPTPPAA